jgi:hypothetical protein
MREHDPRPNDGGSYDPGFISSFYIYPAAQAISFVPTCHSLCRSIHFIFYFLFFSMKAYYHRQMAPCCYPDADAAIDHLRKSGNLYIEAANMYPEDDENHACKSTNLQLSGRLTRIHFINDNSRFPQLRRTESLPLRHTSPRNTGHTQAHPTRHSEDEANLGIICAVQRGQG